MFTHKNYILASSSKSRSKILKSCGFRFIQIKPVCNEEEIKKKIKTKKRPAQIAKILSFEKAKSVSKTKKFFEELVIGCDTIIYLDNQVFDKAKDIKEAKKKIKLLSGKFHKIVSAITICRRGKRVWECSETTRVKIRNLKPHEIDEYLKRAGSQILESVGCYQLEKLGPQIIEDVYGDFFNVMGLPLFKLLKHVSKEL